MPIWRNASRISASILGYRDRPRLEATSELPALVLNTPAERRVFSWAELGDYAERLAGWLWTQGLRPGQVLGAYLENSIEFIGLVLASLRLGVRLVLFHRRLSPAELEWQLDQCRPSLLVRDDQAGHQAIRPPSYQSLRLPDRAAIQPSLPIVDEPASFTFFTSGTTGYPKAVTLTLANLLAASQASSERLQTRSGERWLLCLPLYHIAGLSILFRAALDGMTVIFQPRFEAAEAARLLWEEQVNLVSLVPTMLYRMMPYLEREGIPPQLRLVLLGGSAVDPELLQRALGIGLPVALTYGLTEAASQVCTALPELVRRKPGTVGKPLMGLTVEIRQHGGEPLRPGEIGEIWVRGPSVAQGYDGQMPFLDGWLPTGDLGYLDEEGDLWVLARRSDLIVSGGENIYPAEVERVLAGHPAVSEVCAFGLPHPEWGQQVAVAVVKAGEVSTEELLAYARRFLAGYKLPRQVFFVPELPRTASGKVMRGKVREMVAG
ncbi:MAG: o-succinylbenzoate--CoA ligase [Anaerolineales bacterium]